MSPHLAAALESLRATGGAIRSLTDTLPPTDVVWKPAPDQWSILEVINHLADEEVEDFRARLDILLHQPERPFAPIDPQGWVTSRGYARRDPGESLRRFLTERERSLTWLQSLDERLLNRTRHHPTTGEMSGRAMLANWVAHDLHHIRQINRLRYERLAARVAPIALGYAGEW